MNYPLRISINTYSLRHEPREEPLSEISLGSTNAIVCLHLGGVVAVHEHIMFSTVSMQVTVKENLQ